MTSAVVVGSGPNGLVGAIRLARVGVAVRVLEAAATPGGGTRSSAHVGPGLIHDDCAAFHPMGLASPALRSLPLAEHGLAWAWPEIDLAHPLDDGSAAVLCRDFGRTMASLGRDGPGWRRAFGPLAARFDDLVTDILRPVVHVPAHPVLLGAFGLAALPPASLTVRQWRAPAARALFGGLAAHSFGSLHAPLSSAVGWVLGAAGHRHGWPVARGGSQAIAGSLVSLLTSLGGTVETGRRVTSLAELGSPDIVLLDVTPQAAVRIAGGCMPGRVRRAFGRYRYGPAAFKVDYAVDGDVPWTNDSCRRAGTVHLGGTFAEIAAAEASSVRGVMPARPFVLVGQQYLADPSRSAGGVNPVWAYAHVPHGYAGDATAAVTSQIERFAPGFGRQVVGTHVRTVAQSAAYNPNCVGGDIGTGANSVRQTLARPRIAANPYATGIPGVYLCSAATPPGGGVHGMCGANAADAALREHGIAG